MPHRNLVANACSSRLDVTLEEEKETILLACNLHIYGMSAGCCWDGPARQPGHHSNRAISRAAVRHPDQHVSYFPAAPRSTMPLTAPRGGCGQVDLTSIKACISGSAH